MMFFLIMGCLGDLTVVNAKSYKQLPLKRGVNIDKEWIVTFNKSLDSKTVNTNNIKLVDERNKEIKTNVKLSSDKQDIIVIPLQNYQYGNTYQLIIGEGIKGVKGDILAKETRMEFVAKRPLPKDVKKSKDNNNKFTIVIDAGQLWADYIVGEKGTKGKDINLDVALKLGALLEKKGANVIYTRKSNKVNWSSDKDIENRINITEKAKADLFLSINCNAYEKERVNGIETYYLQGNNQAEKLAEDIQKQLIKYTNRADRGVKTKEKNKSKLLESTSSPSVLVELGFITNMEEEAFLNNKNNQDKYAEAISNAIINYAGIADIEKSEDDNESSKSEEIVIQKIEVINVSLKQGDKYTLPKKVTAVMSDGSKENVEIRWDKSSINTDKVGMYIYNGSVKGVGEKVKLIVKVQKIEENKDDDKEKKKYKVTLNAARGGFDSGAVGSTGLKEKDVNLDIVLRAGKLLEKQGIEIIYTRTSDKVNWNKDNEIQERVKISNNARADLMVTVGCNSYNEEQANGIETYYLDGDKAGKELAQYVENELIKKTGAKYRGVKGVDYLNTIKLSKAPSIWATVGFITNNIEQQRLKDNEYKDRCAQAIAEGVMKYVKANPEGINTGNTDLDDSETVYFDDIVKHIKKGQKYSLPEKVKIKLDNGTAKNVSVTWNTKTVNTNSIGVYRYEGSIKESNKKVSLVLIITQTGKAKFKVAIDPGHGGYDPGAIGITGAREKDITLPVALKVGNYLVKNGVEVIYTRTSDNVSWPSVEKQDLQARCNIANNANVDLFVSIHINNFYREAAHGIETFYFRGSTSGKKLADNIQNELLKETGALNRGTKGSGLYVVDKVNTTSVLTELGFLSNTSEAKALVSGEYQTKCARAIARGILKNLGVKNIVLD